MSQVDLSKLPAPQLLEDLDYEALYQADRRPSAPRWATAGPPNWKATR